MFLNVTQSLKLIRQNYDNKLQEALFTKYYKINKKMARQRNIVSSKE